MKKKPLTKSIATLRAACLKQNESANSPSNSRFANFCKNGIESFEEISFTRILIK